MTEQERLPLNLTEPGGSRRRTVVLLGIAVIMGAAFGGIVGLVAGRTPALVVAAVVALAVWLFGWVSGRRRVWLQGSRVYARALGTKSVDLREADRLELVVTDVRGTRTVSMLVGGGGRTVNVSLAAYAGTGGAELGILALRRLADALAGSSETSGVVFAELLVGQLRAEARDEPAPARPLYRLASTAPGGRLVQRLRSDAVSRFVASLD